MAELDSEVLEMLQTLGPTANFVIKYSLRGRCRFRPRYFAMLEDIPVGKPRSAKKKTTNCDLAPGWNPLVHELQLAEFLAKFVRGGLLRSTPIGRPHNAQFW